MIDDPFLCLAYGILLLAGGMYPLGLLFGVCSSCCQQECPWFIEFERCLRVEIAGSEPRVGGDCPLTSPNFATVSGDTQRIEVGFGFNGRLSIANVQSRIKIPVRLELSAAGGSRTPVGETRTQVWRFNRPEPQGSEHFGQGPPASSYDVLGPPWHLQVDLFVTGVESQDDAGVISSISQDEYGQPKLVLSVNQWDESITHDEIVTLFPTGLQRWEDSLSFRLKGDARSATRVNGDPHSGWLVSKLDGLTIEERALAVIIDGGLLPTSCTGGAILSPTIILNDDDAVAFLEGDRDVNLKVGFDWNAFDYGGPAGDRRVRILPNNAMCGMSSTLIGVGIALGIYPEKVYAQPAQPGLLCDTGPIVMRNESRAGNWKANWYFRNVPRLVSAFPFTVPPWLQVDTAFFYAGKSLMWNAEYGPYREHGTTSVFVLGLGPQECTFSLNGDGDEFYNRPETGPCPDGMVLGGRLTHQSAPNERLNYFNVCTPAEVDLQGSYVITYITTQGVTKTISGSAQGTIPRIADQTLFTFGGRAFVPSLAFSGNIQGEEHQVQPDANQLPFAIRPSFACSVYAEVPCGLSGNLTLKAVQSSYMPAAIFASSQNVELTPPVIQFASRSRPSCGEWSVAPAEGGQITRQCDAGDQSIESASVPPRDSRFPLNLGYGIDPIFESTSQFLGPGPTQLGSCKVLGLGRDKVRVPPFFENPQRFLRMFAGECHRYFVLFGSSNPISIRGDSSRWSSEPCGDCTPTIEILAGAENATVQFREDTDNAYVVEVQARRAWRGAEGVTFAVTCGDATVTQELRRVNTEPTAPRNLTVLRGPCSQAALQWESPDWDGGSPITSYTVQFRRIGGAFATFSSVSPPLVTATVTGLLRLGYEFRVAARNRVGTGEFSNVAVDGFALGAPTNLVAAPRDPCDRVTLSWSPPAQSECIVVKEYRVEAYFVAGEPVIGISVPGDVTTVTVTGLSPTVARQFWVRREDDAGTFLFSNVITVDGCPPE